MQILGFWVWEFWNENLDMGFWRVVSETCTRVNVSMYEVLHAIIVEVKSSHFHR